MPGGDDIPSLRMVPDDEMHEPWEPGSYLVFTRLDLAMGRIPSIAYWDGTEFVGVPRSRVIGWAGLSSPLVGD